MTSRIRWFLWAHKCFVLKLQWYTCQQSWVALNMPFYLYWFCYSRQVDPFCFSQLASGSGRLLDYQCNAFGSKARLSCPLHYTTIHISFYITTFHLSLSLSLLFSHWCFEVEKYSPWFDLLPIFHMVHGYGRFVVIV